MGELRYNVVMENELIAENMRLEYAIVLAKALLEQYWQEAMNTGLTVTITTAGRKTA